MCAWVTPRARRWALGAERPARAVRSLARSLLSSRTKKKRGGGREKSCCPWLMGRDPPRDSQLSRPSRRAFRDTHRRRGIYMRWLHGRGPRPPFSPSERNQHQHQHQAGSQGEARARGGPWAGGPSERLYTPRTTNTGKRSAIQAQRINSHPRSPLAFKHAHAPPPLRELPSM